MSTILSTRSVVGNLHPRFSMSDRSIFLPWRISNIIVFWPKLQLRQSLHFTTDFEEMWYRRVVVFFLLIYPIDWFLPPGTSIFARRTKTTTKPFDIPASLTAVNLIGPCVLIRLLQLLAAPRSPPVLQQRTHSINFSRVTLLLCERIGEYYYAAEYATARKK